MKRSPLVLIVCGILLVAVVASSFWLASSGPQRGAKMLFEKETLSGADLQALLAPTEVHAVPAANTRFAA